MIQMRDRVRENTAESVNETIDDHIVAAVRDYARQTEEALDARIQELDREWDIERWLETNASSVGLIGLGLGASVNRRWFALTAGVLGFLLLHGTQGWCPPLPVLRRLGVRTRTEINEERFALKYLRGDFDHVRDPHGAIDPGRLLAALRN
jgi:hypothetical protein